MFDKKIQSFWQSPITNIEKKNSLIKANYIIPESVGEGFVTRTDVSKGIKLAVFNYIVNGSNQHLIEQTQPIYGFNFCLSGNVQMVSNKKDHSLSPNETGIFFSQERKTFVKEKHNDHIIRFFISIKPNKFAEILGKDFHNLPEELQKPIKKGIYSGFNQKDKLTPDMHKALHDILYCPYIGSIERLFIESRVLELIAYKLNQIINKKTENQQVYTNSKLTDKIYHSGEFLTQNYQNPPDLMQLSRLTGLSRNKLLKSFKKIYGVSPANFVRYRRLEKAKLLLEEGLMNVTEVSNYVGYSNLSHFALIFKKHYGVLPGAYLKK